MGSRIKEDVGEEPRITTCQQGRDSLSCIVEPKVEEYCGIRQICFHLDSERLLCEPMASGVTFVVLFVFGFSTCARHEKIYQTVTVALSSTRSLRSVLVKIIHVDSRPPFRRVTPSAVGKR